MQTKPNVEISIVIQGPVGAGKTTIGHLIKEALEKDGFAVVPAAVEAPTGARPMNRWAHRIDFVSSRGSEPTTIVGALADLLADLPEQFRALEHDGESLDDLLRYLREDAASRCTHEGVDDWLDKVWDWGDRHGLFLNVVWR